MQKIIWRNISDCLPRNGQKVLMAWRQEKAIMQGKYFSGKNTMLTGFCVSVPKYSYYVKKIGVSHWVPLSEVLPTRDRATDE